jgi:hypothetical protein
MYPGGLLRQNHFHEPPPLWFSLRSPDRSRRREERAAILEYDGGLSRAEAEAQAADEVPELPAFLNRRNR